MRFEGGFAGVLAADDNDLVTAPLRFLREGQPMRYEVACLVDDKRKLV